ncbi:MAG TPA: transcription termination factor NusA [Rhodothermales bacterium]|nr:transcription termination factor NusA [Rhodothermales bacterium]
MQSLNLVSSFAEIAREKGIDRDALQMILEDVFRVMIKKRYGSDESFDIIFNPDNGDIQIYHVREVVDDMNLEDPVTEIEHSDAVTFDDESEVGDEVANEVLVGDFGRRAIMMARQTFSQKIRDFEKEKVVREYTDLIGEIVVGEIYQIRKREVLVIHNKVELVLPKEEQIYRDRYRKGDMIRAVVKEVSRDAGSNPQVVISRADPIFMERLFELEVPEMNDGVDGIVEIKKIVREPGDRAKVAVVSYDDRIDPVGACVGMKGVRIHSVVRELSNENIDVIEWSDNPTELIGRAIAPAKPVSIQLYKEERPPRARVVVNPDEVSLAIGRGGQNIRLASKLSGFEIDVYREIPEGEEDLDIDEFDDELSPEIIERLRGIGCDSAKAVLDLSVEELSRRAGFETELSEHILALMRAEFEDESEEEQV